MLLEFSWLTSRKHRAPRLRRLGCAVLLWMSAYPDRGAASVGLQMNTQWGVLSGTLNDLGGTGSSIYDPSPHTPILPSSYWGREWRMEEWPRPIIADGVKTVAPFSQLAITPLAQAPVARQVGVIPGEFVLLDAEGRPHIASAQHPDTWRALGTGPARSGGEGFSFYGSLLLLTDQGFEQHDPGPRLLLEPEPETSPVLASHPLRFAPTRWMAVRPGTTYSLKNGQLVARPNTGLILPRLAGDTAATPPRPHALGKIVNSGDWLYAVGELNENTPGIPPGTQALFRSTDSGLTWLFQPLPRLTGRWRDLAIADNALSLDWFSPLSGQIVIVGDDGIYTCRRDGDPWLHIPNNFTTTATEPYIAFPQGALAPINEALPLRLRSITWQGNRFVAAGLAEDGSGNPVFVEGVSRYWFAYPLGGWPQGRSVDQIVTSAGRLLLLSHADGAERPVFLAADTPAASDSVAGLPPVLPAFLAAYPTLGSATPISLHNPAASIIRRYIIDGEGAKDWVMSYGALHPPLVSSLLSHRFIDEEPRRFTITAINEFGRSAPATVDVTPRRPPLPFAEPAAARLQPPKSVRLVYGAPVNIPIKAVNDVWDPALVWAYGLPEGLEFDPKAQAIVGHALNPGSYHVQFLAFRNLYHANQGMRASFSTALRIEIGSATPKPIDVGTFTGLLEGAEALAGRWTVTLQANRSFTGKLVLAGANHGFRGTLAAEPSADGVFAATILLNRGKKLPPLTLDLVLQATEGRLSLFVEDGAQEAATVGGSVAHAPWAKDRHTSRAGRYMATLRLETDDPRPVGTGFVRIDVGVTGNVSLVGELANGLKWTDSAPLASDGTIPVRWQSSGGRSLRGLLAFDAASPLTTALRGTLDWRTKTEEKCPVYGHAATLAVRGDQAPAWEKYQALPFVTQGDFNLVVRHEDLSRFGLAEAEMTTPFHAYLPQPKVAAYGYQAQTNPAKLTLRTDRSTRLITGQFNLAEPVGGKSIKRQITLRGAIVTDPDTGKTTPEGYFLFSVDGETAQRSGRFFTHPKSD